MSFRKRNVVVASPGKHSNASEPALPTIPSAGIRPSPLDGRLTTSTGTKDLDALISGHCGLPLGSSILIEEYGTTDFGGALLRYYAAEGLVQGHHVHVFGMHENWCRDLPGLSTDRQAVSSISSKPADADKMKIAWRYERLGEFGKDRTSVPTSPVVMNAPIFCHDFDLTKRLIMPSPSLPNCVPASMQALDRSATRIPTTRSSQYQSFIHHLISQMMSTPPTSIHRVIIPNLLSPAVYAADAAMPDHMLQFLHSLKSILRKYPSQLTCMMTLPLSLYSRSCGLVKWTELLSDGVLELAPFPSDAVPVPSNGAHGVREELPQGILKMHRLPILHEKGGGGGESGFDNDMAFHLSRRKGLVIRPYSLPPMDSDADVPGQAPLTGLSDKASMNKIDF